MQAPTALGQAVPLWRLRLQIEEVDGQLRQVREHGDPGGSGPVAALLEQAGGAGYDAERRLTARLAKLRAAEAVAVARAAQERSSDPDQRRQQLQEAIEVKQRRLAELTAEQQAKHERSMARLARGERLIKAAAKPEDVQGLRKRQQATRLSRFLAWTGAAGATRRATWGCVTVG